MYKDSEIISVSSKNNQFAEKDFTDLLDEMEEKTVRTKQVPIKSIRLTAVPSSAAMPAGMSEVEKDTADHGTHLFLSADGVPFVGVRETALPSLYQRIGVAQAALKDAPLDEAVSILNRVASYNKKDSFLAVVSDGKLNAALSDGSSALTYRVIKQRDVFNQMREIAVGLNNGAEPNGFSGTWSFASMGAQWIIDRRAHIGGKEFKTAVSLVTSDIGNNAITLAAGLYANGMVIPMMSNLTIEHRKKNTSFNVLNAVQSLEQAASRSEQDLNDLADLHIEHGENCALHLAHDIGLPKRIMMQTISEHARLGELSGEDLSALDVYFVLADGVNRYCKGQMSPRLQMRMRGNLLKAIGTVWSLYDTPEPFVWSD